MNLNFALTRALWFGAALLPLSVGLSGCGGGGGTGPRPTPLATPIVVPVATPTAVPAGSSYNKERYTPNYVQTLEDTRNPIKPTALLRWRVFPISVYFVRDSSYSNARQNLTTQGFDQWVTATNGATGGDGVSYRVSTNASTADIMVDFSDFSNSSNGVLGTTYSFYDEDSRLIRRGDRIVNGKEQKDVGTRIEIAFTGDRDNDLVTAAHEFGHALGINGHSPNRPDLMYLEGNDQFGGGISAIDLNTLLTSYNGVFNKNANTRIEPTDGRVVESIIHEKMGEHEEAHR